MGHDMNRERITRIILILGVIALLILIVERLWAFGETLKGVLSTLAGAWFLSFMVRPFIDLLHRSILPAAVVRWVGNRYGTAWGRRVSLWRLPYGVAVGLAYTAMVVIVVGVATILVAAIIPQATDLINRLPEISARIPSLFVEAWVAIAQRFGVDPNAITSFVSAQDITAQVTQIAGSAAQQALAIVTGAATLIGQFFLMLILSLYIVTEGKMIQRQFFVILPNSVHEFVRACLDAVDRAFQGYLRGYIVSAFVRALGTIVLFGFFQVNFGIVLALVYAILSLIPLIGSPIAILIAAIVTLVVRPDVALPVITILFVFDQVVAYIIIPRIMSNTVGVPGLVGLLSISIGVQLFGFWGLIFSVPAMGAVYILLFEYYLPRRHKAEGLSDEDLELHRMMQPQRPGTPAVNRPGGPEPVGPEPAARTGPNPSLRQE
jgi:predicted PurR-regulated permease PerM